MSCFFAPVFISAVVVVVVVIVVRYRGLIPDVIRGYCSMEFFIGPRDGFVVYFDVT